jgi:hypothetical protein
MLRMGLTPDIVSGQTSQVEVGPQGWLTPLGIENKQRGAAPG